MKFSPDGTLLAIGMIASGRVFLFQTSDWSLVKLLHGLGDDSSDEEEEEFAPQSVDFISFCGNAQLLVKQFGRIRIWNLSTYQFTNHTLPNVDYPYTLDVSADGEYLAFITDCQLGKLAASETMGP
jgi:WD40 repeat protein